MSTTRTIAIVGVGLIGGSLGKAILTRGLANRVIGIGRNPQSLAIALEVGAVTEISTDLPAAVCEADVVVICTPVDTIAPLVQEIVAHCPAHALITDAGSTKAEIVLTLAATLPKNGPQFVGSHPMAGSHSSGPAESDANLFCDREVIVTPVPSTDATSLRATELLWKSVGARVTSMTPERHDAVVAATSHLPRLVAGLLAGVTRHEDLPHVATGWLDTTRVASANVELWRQIVSQNRVAIMAALDAYQTQLQRLQRALESNDQAVIESILNAGKERRDSVGN